jgi:Domain of unknown function (DUF4112)
LRPGSIAAGIEFASYAAKNESGRDHRREEHMSKVFVEPPPPRSLRDEAVARNLERIAWLMDRSLTIPGTRISIGLDAILGLLPVGGDVLTGLVQAGLVLIALRHYKVPKSIAARMVGNVLLDVAIGSIPFLGDLFDAGFKANTRNVRLLQPYGHPAGLEAPPHKTPWIYILPIGAVLLLVLTLVLIGFITVVRWLFGF